jgi:hypothetical protein
MTKITGTSLGDQYAFLIVYHSIRLRMRNVSENVVVKIKAHILCSITFLENLAFCKIIRKNTAQLYRPHDKGARSLRTG